MGSSNILKVDNMDNYVKENQDKQVKQLHFLLPKHPYRILIAGGSSSGKSNLLLCMLTKMLPYDRLYVFSRHLDQPKYVYLKKYITDIEKAMKKKFKMDINIIKVWSNKLEDMPNIEDFDKSYRNLVIIDDFVICSKSQMARIADYFTRVRHMNTSVILLNQMYHRTDRAVRLNLSQAILFQNNNRREVSLLATELGSDLEKGEFAKLYNTVLSKKYNFLYIDNESYEKPLRYRKGFDELYTRDFNLTF